MTKRFKKGSLGNALIRHDNDYRFDAGTEVCNPRNRPDDASIILLYHEAHETLPQVVGCLISAIRTIESVHSNWSWELIVVDDGSDSYPAFETIPTAYRGDLRIVRLPTNRGRAFGRNAGLLAGGYSSAVFIDADVLIEDPLALLRQLQLQSFCRQRNIGCVSVGLFDFQESGSKSKAQILDFRIHCIYQGNWIGCDSDRKFVGTEYKVMDTTDNLRRWPTAGFLGPWMLPNMVLGGLFTVDRREAIRVGGCSSLFAEYGFEETSLVTKLVAAAGHYIIPVRRPRATHLETGHSTDRDLKDLMFQKYHRVYFESFLNKSVREAASEAINGALDSAQL